MRPLIVVELFSGGGKEAEAEGPARPSFAVLSLV